MQFFLHKICGAQERIPLQKSLRLRVKKITAPRLWRFLRHAKKPYFIERFAIHV
jgi:hypothetical protein